MRGPENAARRRSQEGQVAGSQRRAARSRLCLLALGAALGLSASPASSSETIAYTYDALGRLVEVSRSGSVNDGVNSSYSYDPADNRTNVTVGGSSGGGGGDPPPPNQPPVAQPDNGGTVAVCSSTSVNVIANDTDPDGHYPLSLAGIQSVSPGGYGDAWVQSSTHVAFMAGSWGGGVQITYIVQDSLGATATGVLGITIVGDGCWLMSQPGGEPEEQFFEAPDGQSEDLPEEE